jgi:hypothetical protein
MITTGHIGSDGKYHRGEDQKMAYDVNITHKEYEHDMGRKEFARDIIQPHVNGKPNVEFIHAYPEYSKKYWSQEVIDKTLREQV